MIAALPPMIDWIGDTPVYHGERGDMDPANPEACLCGAPVYYLCDGPGIASMSVSVDGDGHVAVTP